MNGEQVLQWIWSDLVEHKDVRGGSHFVSALRNILHVPVVSLACGALFHSPLVIPESREIAPGITVGDALHEELDIFVDPGALVVFEPARAGKSGAAVHDGVGLKVGQVLNELFEEGYDVQGADVQNVVTPRQSRSDTADRELVGAAGLHQRAQGNLRARYQFMI